MQGEADVWIEPSSKLPAVKRLRFALALGVVGLCFRGCASLPHMIFAVLNVNDFRDYLSAEKWQYALTAAGWTLIASAFLVSSKSVKTRRFAQASIIGGLASMVLAASALILWIFSEFGIILTDLENRLITASTNGLSFVGWIVLAIGLWRTRAGTTTDGGIESLR